MSNNMFNNIINSTNINSIITGNISSSNFFSDFDKDFFSVLDEEMRQTTNQFLSETEYITQLLLTPQEDNASLITTLLNHENQYSYQEYIDGSLNEYTSIKKLISDEGKKQLRQEKYSKNEKNMSCPITLTDFNENDIITKLPCGHCFEPTAIDHWLSTEKAECPVCRFELDYIE